MVLNILALLFVSFAWGLSFVLIKYTESTVPPLTLMAERGIWGVVAMIILCLILRRDIKGHAKYWSSFLMYALLGIAFPWTLVSMGEVDVSGAIASVLVSVTPIVAFIISVFFTKEETLKLSNAIGLILAVIGLVVVIGLDNLMAGGAELKGALLIVIGFSAFGIAGVLIRKTAAKTDAVVSTTYFVFFATIAMMVAALIFEDPIHTDLSHLDIILEIILGVFCFSIAFIVYYWLINRTGGFFPSLTFYLVPIMGLIASYFILGDTLDYTQVIGMLIVLFSVYLINKDKINKP